MEIQIKNQDFKKMQNLYKNFYKIHGNEDAVWDLSDLDDMRKIGQEFMEVFAANSPSFG